MLDELAGAEPLFKFLARGCGKVWLHREQLQQGSARCFQLAELSVRGRDHRADIEVARHVDLEGDLERAAVVLLAVGIPERGEPVPSGMIGIELPGAFHQGAATFPVALVQHQGTEIRSGARVHRVERDGSLRRAPERHDLPPEKQSRGQGVMGEVIGRRGLDGTMRRRQRAPEGIRPDVEPVCVLVPVHHRQRGPAAGLIGRILNGPLQSVSRLRMLLGSGAFEVPEVAQHRLVRAQLIRALLS